MTDNDDADKVRIKLNDFGNAMIERGTGPREMDAILASGTFLASLFFLGGTWTWMFRAITAAGVGSLLSKDVRQFLGSLLLGG